MATKKGQVSSNNDSTELEDGGPLPGEVTTTADKQERALAGQREPLQFETVTDRERDKYAPFERPLFKFEAIGSVFTGMHIDNVLKGEGEDSLEFNAILMRVYPSGSYCYIPAHMQLWEFFAGEQERGNTEDTVYQLTLAEVKRDDKRDPEKVTFVRYTIAEAKLK